MSSEPTLGRSNRIASVAVLLASLIVVPSLGKSGHSFGRSIGSLPLLPQQGFAFAASPGEGRPLPLKGSILGRKTRLHSDGVFWTD